VLITDDTLVDWNTTSLSLEWAQNTTGTVGNTDEDYTRFYRIFANSLDSNNADAVLLAEVEHVDGQSTQSAFVDVCSGAFGPVFCDYDNDDSHPLLSAFSLGNEVVLRIQVCVGEMAGGTDPNMWPENDALCGPFAQLTQNPVQDLEPPTFTICTTVEDINNTDNDDPLFFSLVVTTSEPSNGGAVSFTLPNINDFLECTVRTAAIDSDSDWSIFVDDAFNATGWNLDTVGFSFPGGDAGSAIQDGNQRTTFWVLDCEC
jgi:hypothetical protein